jgi:hypothetical protein
MALGAARALTQKQICTDDVAAHPRVSLVTASL